MAIFGSLSTVRNQVPSPHVFAPSFAYLDTLFASGSATAARVSAILPGQTAKVELSEGAFALEQAYYSKPRSEGFFESHRKYVDLQVLIEGEEWMEVADLKCCSIRTPYAEERDLMIFEQREGSRLWMKPGDIAIFYPEDVHMPGLCGVAGPGLVRKCVIKLPLPNR
jgi:biofilm protein TabA